MKYFRFYEIDSEKKLELSICAIVSICGFSILAFISLVMLVGGFDTLFGLAYHLNYQVTEGTIAYDVWEELPVPIYFRVYFFNLTNPEEVLEGGKPILKELGPYVFTEQHTKDRVVFNENETVSYLQTKTWYWDQDLSGNHSVDDLITFINPVPVAASYIVEDDLQVLFLLNKLFNIVEEPTIISKPVIEILFDGYEDPVLTFIHEEILAENGTFHFLDNIFDLPAFLKVYDRFGWFYKRNDTPIYEGTFNMNTGESGLKDVGLINTWKFNKHTGSYDPPCDLVEGSAGELWPPGLDKTFLELFSSDLCMSLQLDYLEEMEDSHGIEGYRYWGSKKTFANRTYEGETCSYCVEGKCDTPSGT